ncbi:sensor histidine kinase [Paenibacillus sp. sptzw28]|uniref:sensor histidine kinase n=1 Tax=Paenibacillus sp. sptzw28 TaxID=715179 RepID=UPI002163AD37|nr:sensor histidine kinase [Paenibacillus sp. sptzw28]
MLFSLRNQIVILFTVLLLIPVSILTFVLTDKTEGLVRHSIETSTDQTITQYATYVNNLAIQFKDMSNQVLSSSITQDYVMTKDNPMLRAKFREFLSSVYSNNRNSLSISVFDDSGGIWRLDQSFRKSSWYNDFVKGRNNSWVQAHIEPDQPESSMRQTMVNSYVSPLINLNLLKAAGIIKINFSTDLLQKPLERIRLGRTGQAYLLSDDGRTVLNQDIGSNPVISKHLDLAQKARRTGYLTIHDGDKSFLLFARDIEEIPGWFVVGVVSEQELFQPISAIRLMMIILSAVLLACSVIAAIAISTGVTRPLSQLTKAMKLAEQGDFKGANALIPRMERRNEAGYVVLVFRKMIDRLNHFIDTEYKTNIRRQNAEYKALLLQINPHFLNNTLEIIGGLAAQGKSEEVMDITEQFGEMMSYSLKLSEDTVYLFEELKYIENYTSILKSRFGDRLVLDIRVDKEALHCKLIKFILQPIVENAIKYSIDYRETAKVDLEIRRKDKTLYISVKDNGVGMSKDQIEDLYSSVDPAAAPEVLSSEGNRIGLSNVLARCRLYYGDACEIKLNSVLGEGTTISFKLPML